MESTCMHNLRVEKFDAKFKHCHMVDVTDTETIFS